MNVDRLARECDIVISAALPALRNGTKTTDELVAAAHRAWPNVGLTNARVGLAIEAARNAGLLSMTKGSPPRWALTEAGFAEAGSAHDWATEEITRSAETIKARLRPGYGEVSDQESRVWLQLVCEAVAEGIRHSIGVYQGAIDGLPGAYAVPRSLDHARIDAYVNGAPLSDAAKVALGGLVYDAIDRSSDFGNALVSHVTVGYVLQAFLARRDHIQARNNVGSLTGIWAILDTMILLRLLGGPVLARPVWDAIASAQQAGMDVIVGSQTMDELLAVVGGVDEEAAEVEAAIKGGVATSTLAMVVSNEPVKLWLQGSEAGVYRNWRSFREAANGLNGMLARSGVRVQERYGGPPAMTTKAQAALTSELRSRTAGFDVRRRPRAIERDATTMAMAWHRRSEIPAANGLWPAAWIVTDDTHLAPAYRALDGADAIDLSLAPGQWVAVLSTFAEPATLADLATSATSLMVDETLFELAGSVTTSEAIEIARALDPEAATDPLELRIEQLTLRQALATVATNDSQVGELRMAVATRVAARRSLRAGVKRAALLATHDAERKKSAADLAGAYQRLDTLRQESGQREELFRLERIEAVDAARNQERFLLRRSVGVAGLSVATLLLGFGTWPALSAIGLEVGVAWFAVFGLIGALAAARLWVRSSSYRSSTAVRGSSLVAPAVVGSISLALTVAIALAIG